MNLVPKNDIIIPSHIQIETVAGICTFRCIMCPIKKSIRKEVMSTDKFETILKKILYFKEKIQYISLLGLGETLLDKEVVKKVVLAKQYGFNGVGIYTNGSLLSPQMSEDLINSKLDSLIISIDGITPDTQERIRPGSNTDKLINQIRYFIKIRKQISGKTRLILRFTKQKINKLEWPSFYNYWKNQLSAEYNDSIFCYHVHNCGDMVNNYKALHIDNNNFNNLKCPEVFSRMIIFSNGDIGLCCGDQFGNYKIGNIFYEDPLILYNHKIFKKYRKTMIEGNILKLKLCKNCTVMYSIYSRKHFNLK